jgi:dTDP-4-amino-4,6-dideoxygalactose transaminase
VFGEPERKLLNDVFENGLWWYGERVKQFEREFASFQGARFSATCSSGTTAAEIFFHATGIGPGDEVIVPPYTFFATASSVARVGATPVFADVDASWCLDPDAVEAAISPRTKAIVPVHFAGRIADMDRLNAIAEKHGIMLMEDACHAWGARWRGRGAGALGKAGVFSFQASKNITAGEGGAISSDDEEIIDKCRALINCGRRKGSQWYCHAYIGTNARMTELSAALLLGQLTRLDEQTERRIKNAAILDRALESIEGLTPQPGDARITRRGYHLYCITFDADTFGCSRERFAEAAQAEGLPVALGYGMPLYRQEAWGGKYDTCRCPVSEDLCYRTGLWLAHTLLLGDEEDMGDIVRVFQKIQRNVSHLR